MKLGAQLYTVRKSCTDLESFSETLKRVADMGYTTVQVSGTCDYEADWLAEQLKACELKAVLTHIKPERIIGETKKVCDDHKIFGCRNIGLGVLKLEKKFGAVAVLQYAIRTKIGSIHAGAVDGIENVGGVFNVFTAKLGIHTLGKAH